MGNSGAGPDPPKAADRAQTETTVVRTPSSVLGTGETRMFVGGERIAELPEPGARFGGDDGQRFELSELLGRGGMGSVYLARDLVLERTVAVKFIVRHGGSVSRGELVQRLKQEARATASLNHENIMRVFDLG